MKNKQVTWMNEKASNVNIPTAKLSMPAASAVASHPLGRIGLCYRARIRNARTTIQPKARLPRMPVWTSTPAHSSSRIGGCLCPVSVVAGDAGPEALAEYGVRGELGVEDRLERRDPP